MFKDIGLSIDNNKVDFEYEIDKDKVIIKTIDELKIGKNLKIFYRFQNLQNSDNFLFSNFLDL